MTSTTALTEKDMLQDILVLEKDIVKTYGSYLIEASCPNLRNILTKNLKDNAGDQYQVFSSMNARNYYPVKEAQEQDVQQAKTKFDEIADNLN
jgi:spore coat protein CotF